MNTATRLAMWIDGRRRDLRFAVRVLLRTPSFTVAAVASLALGIAVNTTMFSIVNALLLEPLGAGGDGLVRIGRNAAGDRSFRSATVEELEYLRGNATSFADIVGHQIEGLTTGDVEGPVPISAEVVGGNYFSVLGAPPRLGRAFDPDENHLNSRALVAVVSDRLWRRRFDADPSVIGRAMPVNGHSFTIIGVAPPGFSGTFRGVDVDLWIPTGAATVALRDGVGSRQPEISLMLIGRLREGVTREAAEAELRALARRMAQDDPRRDKDRGFVVGGARGVHPLFAGPLRVFLSLLMAVVAVVLLIACANVAGLLLARANARSGEVAVRMAVGASRGQVIAQLLVESLVLGVLGGLAGLVLSVWPLKLLRVLTIMSGPTGTPVFLDLQLDARVLAFTASATVLTAVVFGLAPAIQATRISLSSRLRETYSMGGRRRFWLQSALMVLQVSASFVLLVAAALLFRSLRNTDTVDMGFAPDGVVVASVDTRKLGYDAPRAEQFHDDLLAGARTLPGTAGAALADFVPVGERGGHPLPLQIAGVAPPPGERGLTVAVGRVSDAYFTTMRQPLVRGRDFTPHDRVATPTVAIINEAMARRYWPGKEAVGQRLRLGEGLREHHIVGVVGDARFSSFGGAVEPLVYTPGLGVGKLHIRTSLPPDDALRAVRGLVQSVGEGGTAAVPHLTVRPLRDILASSGSLLPLRIARFVFGVAGVIALLLATGGLYSLVSYALERRMKEIGIRVAMGANRRSVFGVIVGGAFRLTGIGLVVGIALAGAVTHLFSRFLYGLSPIDPLTFAGIALLLALVTLAAGYAAARRGLNVDPMVVLRYE